MKEKLVTFIFLSSIITVLNCNAQTPIQIPDEMGSGNCLDFDGSNDWINIPNVPYSNQFTATAWFRAHSLPNNGQAIIQQKGTGDWGTGWAIKYNNSGLTWTVNNEAETAAEFFRTVVNINTDEWYHVAWSSDGTSFHRLYLNGELIDEVNWGYVTSSNVPVIMGRYVDGGSISYFDGKIDEVSLWNRALSQNEIKNNMCQKLAGNETNLVGYWNLNEGIGNNVNDLTTNAHHGTRQ